MSVSSKHILQQGPVIGAFLQSAVGIAKQSLIKSSKPTAAPTVPGPVFEKTTSPLPAGLIQDYSRHVGADPGWYRSTVPAHLFPQWVFPLSQKTLKGLPYPIEKVMNGGCRLEINGAIPQGEPLVTTAQLTDLDDNGSRAVITQKMNSGTAEHPNLITTYFYPIVPLKRSSDGAKKTPPIVPTDAREISRWQLGKSAGLDFAKLTGDFNPIHWINSYAKAFGFRGVIIHGFSTMAHAIESLNRNVFGGDVSRLAVFDARFTRPLHYPANVGIYIDGKGGVFVGDGPGAPAYLVGSYESR